MLLFDEEVATKEGASFGNCSLVVPDAPTTTVYAPVRKALQNVAAKVPGLGADVISTRRIRVHVPLNRDPMAIIPMIEKQLASPDTTVRPAISCECMGSRLWRITSVGAKLSELSARCHFYSPNDGISILTGRRVDLGLAGDRGTWLVSELFRGVGSSIELPITISSHTLDLVVPRPSKRAKRIPDEVREARKLAGKAVTNRF